MPYNLKDINELYSWAKLEKSLYEWCNIIWLRVSTKYTDQYIYQSRLTTTRNQSLPLN